MFLLNNTVVGTKLYFSFCIASYLALIELELHSSRGGVPGGSGGSIQLSQICSFGDNPVVFGSFNDAGDSDDSDDSS